MLGQRSFYMLFVLPALALPACGGEKPVDEAVGAVEEAMPAPGAHLAGTYTGTSKQIGDFSQLVLKTDGTYHARVVVACMVAPCRDVEQDGRYTLLRRESLTYFQTYDVTGTAKARYQYTLQGDVLSVRRLNSNSTATRMVRSQAAWCAVTQDCALQELQIGPCAGQYICMDTGICNWQCGAAPEIAGKEPKTGNGG